MEQLHDVESFAKVLTSKGYDGYFHTGSAFPGKVKDSLTKYMEMHRVEIERNPRPELTLTGYLKWDGEELPSVQCNMVVRHESGKFDVQKMEITKNDRYGQLLKKVELDNLTVNTLPKIADAITMVNEELKLNTSDSKNSKRMRF